MSPAKATFPARLDDLSDMMAFLEKEGARLEVPAGFRNKLELACEEALVNVISYAYPEGSGDLSLEIRELPPHAGAPRGIEIVLVDSGIPFDPLAHTDPDMNVAVEDRTIGGLGIFLIRKTMDEVHYSRDHDRNIFTMRKRFGD